jgi:hypothetical protein
MSEKRRSMSMLLGPIICQPAAAVCTHGSSTPPYQSPCLHLGASDVSTCYPADCCSQTHTCTLMQASVVMYHHLLSCLCCHIPPVTCRFDIILILKDTRNNKWDDLVAWRILHNHEQV